MKGVFITFDGIEGCGKSTQAKLLYEYLKSTRRKCVYTHEPGGTSIGEDIRNILLNPKNKDIAKTAELLLFEASRAQLIAEVIAPALRKGVIVICDRFNDSTYAYQAYAGGVNKNIIRAIEDVSIGRLKPDLTILLDTDTKSGLTRTIKADRIQGKSFSFHNKVRRGYLDLANRHPGRIKVIKTQPTADETQILVRKVVNKRIGRA